MPPNDPNQIDINLSLFPGHSESVVNSLVKQLSDISTQLTAINLDITTREAASRIDPGSQPFAHGTSSGGSTSQATEKVHAEQIQNQQTIQGSRPSASAPDAETQRKIDDAVGRRTLQNMNMRQTIRYMATGKIPGDDIGAQEAADRMTENLGGRGPARTYAQRWNLATAPGSGGRVDRQQIAKQIRSPTGSNVGGSHGGGGEPPDDTGGFVPGSGGDHDEDEPAWRRHFSQEELYGRFQMPRYGEFTIQDSLQMMARTLGRRAEEARNAPGADPNARFWTGTVGAGLNRMANTVPFISNAMHNIRPLGSMAEAFHPMQLQEIGQYARGTEAETMHIPGMPDGFRTRTPGDYLRTAYEGAKMEARFSEAGARSSYLSMERSRDIGGGLVQAGFDKDTAADAISRYFAPARGSTLNLIPVEQQLELFTQALRAGGTSMDEFAPALSGLADGAKASRMSMQEYAQSVNEYANSIQEMGGTFLGGAQSANAYAAATGLAPQVDLQARQNPLVQARVYQQTGILPQMQGALPSGVTGAATAGTLRMLARGFRHGAQDRVVNVDGGRMVISAQQQAETMAGQQLGLNWEATHRILGQAGFENRNFRTQNTVAAYMQDINKARELSGGDHADFRRRVALINEGHGNSHVSINDIRGSLQRAGWKNPDDVIKGREGKDLEEAVNSAFSARQQELYGENKSGTTDELTRHVKIGIDEGLARKILRIADDSDGKKTMDEKNHGGKVNAQNVLRQGEGWG